MAFMLQLKQAAGTDAFSVIPNTVQTCQRTFDKPVVMTLADPPYTIIQVNKEWEIMTGYSAEEVVGKANCGILQGSITDRKALDDMMHEIRFKRPFSTILTNAKKSGEVFRNFLLLYPLSTDSKITHYLSITNFVDHPSSGFSRLPRLGNTAAFMVADEKVCQDAAGLGRRERPQTPSNAHDSDPMPFSRADDGQVQLAGEAGGDSYAVMPPPLPPDLGSGFNKRPRESV
jgi:PAS domain S-box-containing protein